MRILVVSAHYPPNFISGGTLQPQRIGHELARRGYDVFVYAGWYGEGRPPLETWVDDDAGIPVRWVVATPWTDWSRDENFDNPAVAADFAAVLDETRPDVVHFHSLQSLGAGVVEAATARRIPTVVTMHDFWWVCGRQFLVDRSYEPCSLVVDTGVCECQRGRPWLTERDARLRRVLADVDLVLTPSKIAADVLSANGVDPRRLHVDENGIPDDYVVGHVDARREQTSALRFVYTGGADPMKGARALGEAVATLAGEPGWRLITYGDDGITGPHVERRPPFAPEQLDDVLAVADVLLLPSVMRESYSLVTREALLRGVPVVCTDSLGPEEAVRHGVNGLIVPAADGGALAGAMRRLVREPELVGRLRRPSTDVSVRALTDQVDGLESRYAALSKGTTAPTSRSPSVRRVLFVAGIEGAPLRYRVRLPAEGMALLGVESTALHYRDPRVERAAADADAVVLYRVPATVQVLSLVAALRDRGTPVLFDVDDMIFDPDLATDIPALRILPPVEADLWLEGVRRYRTTLEACDLFVGSTSALCERATELTGLPAERFDNGVGIALGQLSDGVLARRRRTGPARVAYLSGTDTHEEDWAYVEPAVLDALGRHPDAELWLVGKVTPSGAVDRLGRRVRRIPFTPWIDLPSLLRDVDVNLAPLGHGSLFNDAKSAIKWLEAALVETPSIVSPTTPFREAVEHGVNGFLAGDLDEWSSALDALLSDEETRRRVGRRARRDALLRWPPHLQGRRYLAILERAARVGDTPRNSAFEGVALDEPAFDRPSPLEPYDPIEWRRWARRRRFAPVHPRRLAATARSTAARARARTRRSSDGA